MLVEEQIARSLPVLNGQRGEGIVFDVKLHHAPKIDGADHIDVVQDERVLASRPLESRKKWAAFFRPPPVSSRISSREISIRMPKLSVGFEVLSNHVRVMMRVDDHFAHAKGAQAGECDLQQRAAGNFYQRLGAVVGERPQARAQAGGQNHGLHCPLFRIAFSNFDMPDDHFHAVAAAQMLRQLLRQIH